VLAREGRKARSALTRLWVGRESSELLACLEQGLCPSLEKLDLGRYPCSGGTVARCLRQGLTNCPDLRRLRLHLEDESTVVALAAALEEGLYPKLEVLDLSRGCASGGGIILAALRASPRPGIRELELSITKPRRGPRRNTQVGGVPWADATQSASRPTRRRRIRGGAG
jgi:hypothetical protein